MGQSCSEASNTLLLRCLPCLRTYPALPDSKVRLARGRPTKDKYFGSLQQGSLRPARLCVSHGQPGKATRAAIRGGSRLSLGGALQLTSSSGMYSSLQQQSVQKTPPQYRQWVRPLLVRSRNEFPSKRFGQSGHPDTSSSWTHLLLGVRASRAAAMVWPRGRKSVACVPLGVVMISCSSRQKIEVFVNSSEALSHIRATVASRNGNAQNETDQKRAPPPPTC